MTELTPRRRLLGGLGCIAIAASYGISDGVHITQAFQQIGGSALWDLLWGGLAAAATATLIIRSPQNRHMGAQRTVGALLSVGRWPLVGRALLGLVITNPRKGPNDITSGVMVGVATCTGALFIALFLWGGLSLLRPHAGSMPKVNTTVDGWQGGLSHQYSVAHSLHHAEVWHVDVSRDDPDYFIAHCNCVRVGTAHDATEPNAEASARHEANAHAPTVAPLVVEI